YAMIAFVLGGYLVPPLLRRRRLNTQAAWAPFARPERLEVQWGAAKLLLLLGAVSLLLSPLMFRIPTVRAVSSQVNSLIDLALVMISVTAVLARNWRRIGLVFGLFAVFTVVRAVTSGFFGGSLMTGIYLLSLTLLCRRATLLSWMVLCAAGYLALFPYTLWLE